MVAGERFKPTSLEYAAILKWIREGATFDAPGSPRIQSLRVVPADSAHWGRYLDANYLSSRPILMAPLKTSPERCNTPSKTKPWWKYTLPDQSRRCGQGDFDHGADGRTAAVTRVAVIHKAAGPDYPRLQRITSSTQHVFAKLKRLNIRPSDLSSDSEFLRRVYLDTCGVLPSVDETLAFVSSTDPQKRLRVIDRLLTRPEHAELWATKLADMFRLGSFVGPKPSREMYKFLQSAISIDKPTTRLLRNY
jgi:hypothetical protein